MIRHLTKCCVILILPLLISCSPRVANSITNADEPDTGQILKSSFGDEIEYRSVAQKKMLLYCPDNTCNEFVLRRGNESIRVLNDFVYLLFIHSNITNYPKMFEFKENQLPIVVNKVLQRNSNGCSIGSDFVRCVIIGIQQRNGIQALFVRYDENARHEIKMDIEKILKPSRVE